jgi:hypothetical protein
LGCSICCKVIDKAPSEGEKLGRQRVVEFYQMNCTVENTDEKPGINFQNYKEKLLVL